MFGEVNIFVFFIGFFLIMSALMVILASNPVHSVFFLVLVVLCLSSILLGFGIEFLGILLVVVYVGAIAVLFLFVVMMLNLKVDQTNENLVRYVPLVAIISVFIVFEGQFVFDSEVLGSYFNFIYDIQKGSVFEGRFVYHPMTQFPLDGALELPVPTGFNWGFAAALLGNPFFPNMPLLDLDDYCGIVYWKWIPYLSDPVLREAELLRVLIDTDLAVSGYFDIPYLLDEPTNIEAFGILIYNYFSLPFILVGIILLIAMIGPIALTLDHHKSVKRQDIQSQVERDFNRTISLKI